nr:PREDICTED: proteoglycan 4-like isoform X2 [Bemisia tabaci]
MRSKFVVTALLKTLCFLLLCGEAISESTRFRGDASSTQLICAAQDLDLFGGNATGARYVKRQAIQHRKRVPADIMGDQEKIQANSIRARRTPGTISNTDHKSSSAYHIGSDEKERNEFPSTSFRSEGEVPTAGDDDLRSYLRNRIDGGRPKSREDTLVLEKDENMRDPEPEEVADRGGLSPAFPEPPPGVNMKAEENQEPPPEEEKSWAELPPTSNTVSWALSSIEREDEDVQTTEPQPDEEDDLHLLLTPPSVIPPPVETPLVEEPLQMTSVPVEEPKPKTEKPPPTTKKPPPKTEKPPPKTEKPPSKTEKPPSKTEKPPSKTEMPPPKTEKPSPKAEMPLKAEEPPPKTEKPLPKTEKPSPKTEKPEPKAEMPPPKIEKPAPKAEMPPPKAEKPAPMAEKPPPKAEMPPPKAEMPPPMVEKPAPKAEKPALKVEKPPTKIEKPPPKAEKPPPTSLSPLPQRQVVTSNNGMTSPKITGAAVPKLNWTDVATAWELSLQEGVELDSTSAARRLVPWRNAQQRHPISQKLEQRQPIPPKIQKPDQRKPSSPPKNMKKSSAIPRATEAAPAEAPKSRLPSFRVTARKANLQREPKILGASFLDLTQHPYVAVLAGKLETRLVFLCTTTILSETWALSCAHCFFVDGEELVINRLVVVTGQTSLDLSNLSPNAAIYVAKEIHIHPMYAEKSFESITHDLGLVRVRRPFKFNDFVQMIPIRALPLPYLTDPDTDTLIPLLTQSFNWNSKTRELEAINVTLRRGDVDPCPCINWRLSRGLFCTFRRPGETICHGDFGGPLVYRRQLIGVAQGIRSARCDRAYILEDEDCDDASKYAMYINTCIFLDWLNRHVPGVPHQPEECYRLLNAEAGQAVVSATPVLLVAMASSLFFFVNTL